MTVRHSLITAGVALAIWLPLAGSAVAAEGGLNQAVSAFMNAYAAGDWKGVESHLTAGKLYVYGSDLSEFASGRTAFKTMFDNDQKLWRGAARFGTMSDVSSIQQGAFATLFFNRVFQVGDRQITVRFSTVWKREAGDWKLVQSANAVPTVGQSAAEILGRPHP